MDDKNQILTTLKKEFTLWEELLNGLNDEQITIPLRPSTLCIKDVVAHLYAWQQRSIARMEAGLHNREPEYPKWPAEFAPDTDEDLDRVNAWIYETHHERPWSSVYRDWREGFLRFLELGEAIPEKDLLDAEKYPWLEGYTLGFILTASCEHHEEHLEPLRAWLDQHSDTEATG